MSNDLDIETEAHWNKGYSKSKTHYLINEQRNYFNQLAELANIENIPEIYDAIMTDVLRDMEEQPTEFRKFNYTIIDDETFLKQRNDHLTYIKIHFNDEKIGE